MKKTLSFMLVLTLVLSFASIGSFAAEGIEQITFNDGSMFTVGLEEMDEFNYVIKGLKKDQQGNYQKVDIKDSENISWTTSNETVVNFIGSTSGKAVSVEAVGEGEATVTATYNNMTVESNVTVVAKSNKATVKNVNIKINFLTKDEMKKLGKDINNELQDIDMDIPELDNFSLKDIYGASYDDSGVAKNKVTALHTFLYALEEKCDKEGHTDGWDWVKANVEVGYNGSFVSAVGDYENFGMTGWMYKVNEKLPSVAASQYELNEKDQERWGFATWGQEW